MATSDIDFGQAEIQAFGNAVAAGEIKYDPKAARDAADIYQSAIEQLTAIQSKLRLAERADGFGGFQTGMDLQRGFAGKAADGVEVLGQLIDGARRLQETYLRAGNLISEADEVNQQRILSNSVPSNHGSSK